MNAKKQILIFFTSIFMTIFFYIGFIFLGNHIGLAAFQNAEKWIADAYEVKTLINEQATTKQRIFIAGGSSSLFGFNGAMIEVNTDFRFINYATHAGLPLNYHIDKVIHHAKKGDIVILPLEFSYYASSIPSEHYWYIQNMLTWDKDYKKYIDTYHELLAYFKNNPSEILFRMMIDFYKEKVVNQVSKEQIAYRPIDLEEIDTQDGIKITSCQDEIFKSYSYLYLSPNGDFCPEGSKITDSEKVDYLSKDLKLSSFFLSEYQRLKTFADSQNITLILTYPVTLENPLFSLDDKETYKKIENLKAELEKHDIRIYGDFRDSHFGREYFYDTHYHLNAKGAQLRTKKFIQALPQILESAQKSSE